MLGLIFLGILSAYAISGITLENNHALGPGYIFWPVIAILAKMSIEESTKEKKRNKKLHYIAYFWTGP